MIVPLARAVGGERKNGECASREHEISSFHAVRSSIQHCGVITSLCI